MRAHTSLKRSDGLVGGVRAGTHPVAQGPQSRRGPAPAPGRPVAVAPPAGGSASGGRRQRPPVDHRAAGRRAAAGSRCPRRRPPRPGPGPRASRGCGPGRRRRRCGAPFGHRRCSSWPGAAGRRLRGRSSAGCLRATRAGWCPPPGVDHRLVRARSLAASTRASAMVGPGPAFSTEPSRSAMPRSSWDKITPELPRCPISEPWPTALQTGVHEAGRLPKPRRSRPPPPPGSGPYWSRCSRRGPGRRCSWRWTTCGCVRQVRGRRSSGSGRRRPSASPVAP